MIPFDYLSMGGVVHQMFEVALHCLLFGAGLTLAIWLVNRPSLVPSAAHRYRLWAVTLFVVLTLPLFFVAGRAVNSIEFNEMTASSPQPTPLVNETVSWNRTVEEPERVRTVDVQRIVFKEKPAVPATPEESGWIGTVASGAILGIAAAWFMLAAFGVVRLGRDVVRLLSLKRRATSAGQSTCDRTVWLASRLDVTRPVRVLTSKDIDSPVAVGFCHPAILLPEDLDDRLSQSELDHILLHELAHLRRRDDWSLLVERLLQPLFLVNPLSFWLRHRLTLERELACDELVVATLGRPHEYARSLVRLVSLTKTMSAVRLVSPAMKSKSQMFKRFEMLLQTKRPRSAGQLATVILLAVVLIGGTVTVSSQVRPIIDLPDQTAQLMQLAGSLTTTESTDTQHQQQAQQNSVHQQNQIANSNSGPIGIQQPLAGVGMGSSNRWFSDDFDGVSISTRGDRTWIELSTDRSEMRMKIDGDIVFGDDDRSIVSLERGGRVEIEERSRQWRREVTIERASDGSLEYDFREDGDQRAMTDSDREWLGDAILMLIRVSGFNVEERVDRIGRNQGIDALVDEVLAIPIDYGQRIYAIETLHQFELTSAQLDDLISGLAASLESDYEAAEIMVALAEHTSRTESLEPVILDLARTIESSYELRRSLSAFELDRSSDPKVVLPVLRMAQRMDSDFERAELLIGFAPLAGADGEIREAYFAAALDIESDFELRRVLSATGALESLDPNLTGDVLQAAHRMGSDFEKVELLIDLAPAAAQSADVRREYVRTVETVTSAFEARRALMALLQATRPADPDVISAVIQQAGRMNSNFEQTELLVAVATDAAQSEELALAYIGAVARIGSAFEAGRALQTLATAGNMKDRVVEEYIHVAGQLGSSFEAANALISAAQYCTKSDQLKEVYVDAAAGLSSEHDRKRAYEAVGVRERSSSNSRIWY